MANKNNKQKFKCCKCGKEYTDQARNFKSSKSEMYASNNYRLPICNKCIEELFLEYLDFFENNYAKAMKRICEMFDIYYDPDIANKCKSAPVNITKVGYYVRQMNLGQYKNKTYFDYLKEEQIKIGKIDDIELSDLDDEETELFKEAKRIFGTVNNKKDAKILKYYYDDWMVKTGASSVTEETVIKNICWNLLNIQKKRELGEDTTKIEKALLENITFGGWKPDNKDENLSKETFGTWIRKYEMNKPIEKYKDVSILKELVEVYFLGHASKSLGIKNIYVDKYDEHMKKYTVERNEDENKEKDELMEKIFGK